MSNEKLLEAIGYLDEAFLAENLAAEKGKRIAFSNRVLRNAIAAALAVVLLACAVLANTVPAEPVPDWEPYAQADQLLDYLFGTARYAAYEGSMHVTREPIWENMKENREPCWEEIRMPVTSGASREPVSAELAAMVKPYLIPVDQTVTDPTGTVTMKVFAYFYEPQTRCGMAYVQLTDPAGAFAGYVLEQPVAAAGEELPEDRPKGIGAYLRSFEQNWGKAYPNLGLVDLRLVEEESDEHTWTFIVNFWPDAENVELGVGFRTEVWSNASRYRVKLDLERTPTMETIRLHNAMMRETVTVSPVSIGIDGSKDTPYRTEVQRLVIYFKDGSSYVVKDEETCVNGWAATSGSQNAGNGYHSSYMLSNILDIGQIQYVRIDDANYVLMDP